MARTRGGMFFGFCIFSFSNCKEYMFITNSEYYARTRGGNYVHDLKSMLFITNSE